VQDSVETKILEVLIGLTIFVLLVPIVGFEALAIWFQRNIISALISVMFLSPLLYAIIRREAPKEIILFVVGGIALFAFQIALGMGVLDTIIMIMKWFIGATIIVTVSNFINDVLARLVPP